MDNLTFKLIPGLDLTSDQRWLYNKSHNFSKQSQLDLAANKLRFIDSDIMHIANISAAAGTFDLLDSTNDKIVGLSDFDKNKLETGQNAAITKIKVAYGKDATANNTIAQKINFDSKTGGFPVELLRAKLVIRQDNKVLLRIPVERFTHAADSTMVQGNEDVMKLGTPLILVEQKPISLQLEFNNQAPIVQGTYDHYLQVRLMGTETTSK